MTEFFNIPPEFEIVAFPASRIPIVFPIKINAGIFITISYRYDMIHMHIFNRDFFPAVCTVPVVFLPDFLTINHDLKTLLRYTLPIHKIAH
jgi:hypothetical protein